MPHSAIAAVRENRYESPEPAAICAGVIASALLGSLAAVILFLTTLSFMLTSPGIWQPGYGFPFLGSGGGFLIKDLVLLGASALLMTHELGLSLAR